MVTPAVCLRLMPKYPPVTILTSCTVTSDASMTKLQGMDRPLSTVPLAVTTT